jgi:hypothetical protein
MKRYPLLLLFLISAFAVGAFAQDRPVAAGGDALPFAPEETVAKVPVKHDLAKPDEVLADCPTSVKAGNVAPGPGTRAGFRFGSGDVLMFRMVVPVTGVIDTIYWRADAVGTSAPWPTDTSCFVRIFKSNLTDYEGHEAAGLWGGYKNPTSTTGRSPYKDEAGTEPTWITSTNSNQVGGAIDPNGDELWGLGGWQAMWRPARTNFVATLDAGEEPLVTAGDVINICIRVPTDAADPQGSAPYEALGTYRSGWTAPFNFFKYYDRPRLGETDPNAPDFTWGWWAREFGPEVWISVKAQGNLPPTVATVTALQNTISTEPQTVELTAFDCNALNPADTAVASAKLFYAVDGVESSVDMTSSGGVWSAAVPGQPLGTLVSYYCTATDNLGMVGKSSTRTYRTVDLNQAGYTTTFPAINFVDISTTGTQITEYPLGAANVDDGTAGPFPLGFDFYGFFGDTMRYAYIGCNGAITLVGAETDTVTLGASFSASAIPGAAIANFVSAFWNDLYLAPDGNGYVYYQSDANKFTVQWNRVGNFNDAADTTTTFELILDGSDNSITVQYLDVGVTSLNVDGQVGLQKDATTNWLLVNRFGYPTETMPANNFAIKMTYTGTADVKPVGGVPDQYALLQNYPNPFNPSTKITYALPSKEFVVLKVYDVLGREVATLFAGDQAAGVHTVEFDAAKVSGGTYFYQLQAGNFTEVKKMLLLK